LSFPAILALIVVSPTKGDAMNDAIGYIRVSSEEQADSGLGLEAQRQRITAYCTMKGLRLAEVFVDPGISAGKPLASRPAGSRLLAAARKGKAVVVVAKLDRLFRSVADAANVIDDFDKKGIQLVAISEAFDMTSPYGRAMAQMASVFAELERAMIRERTRSAMGVKRSRGERISGYAPFGWDFGPDGRLVENAREQKIIARMRQLRAEGLSYRGIGTRLDEEGIRPKRGRRWIHTAVKSILARNAA
jgi:DNA invertase Pin-like site-specific DNA recombinase